MANLESYKNVWVFAEQRQGKLMNVALELVGEGHKLSREISDKTKVCAVLVGNKVDHLADELFAYGADCVYLLEDELLAQYTTDGYAKAMTDAINEYKPEIVLFGATHIGRDLAPRVAARLNTGLTADCTRLDINVANYMDYLEANTTANLKGLDREDKSTGLKQTRPAFGGNLMATIVTPNTRPQMATVRPGVMAKREKEEGAKGEIVKAEVKLSKEDISVEVLNVVKAAKEIVSLTDAKIICSGGRGLGSAEGFKLMQEFAEAKREYDAIRSGSRCRLDRPEPSGRTDRNNGKTGDLLCVRHQRRNPASGRHADLQDHRSDQQGSGMPDDAACRLCD